MSLNETEQLALFNFAWDELIKERYSEPQRLHEAIRYTLRGEGKRVRALSCLMAAEHYTEHYRSALPAACAVEFIHAYSLVHDDLPCLDNDDWRRGRPSVHRAFDEATALLVGDALLTDAFRLLSDEEWFPDNFLVKPRDQLRQVKLLAKAAGGSGMVLGQAKDVFWTGRSSGFTQEILEEIHLQKTGALMGVAFAMGAAAVGASMAHVEAWDSFGRSMGLVFQAVDDALDATSGTGKSSGKDIAQGKLTYLKFKTKDEILAWAEPFIQQALVALPVAPTEALRAFAIQLLFRKR